VYPPKLRPEKYPPMPPATHDAFEAFMVIADGLSVDQQNHYDKVETDAVENRYDEWAEADEAAHRVFIVAYESGRISRRPDRNNWRDANEVDLAADRLCVKPAGGGSYLSVAIACMDLIDPADLALICRVWTAADLPLPLEVTALIGSVR
jgi:hypothetical protein